MSSRRSAFIPILTAGLFLGATVAQGAPSDPFSAALPGADSGPAEGAPSAAGEGSVSEQQGSASYSYPIAVPPGRLGMQPSLALSYSSGGALRGGIGVGWSLDLPTIERDADAPGEVRYRLNMPGTSGVLVPVTGDPGTGTRYRVELDEQFARVERTVNGSWEVATPDGRIRSFEGAAFDGVRWNLTRERDSFGNQIVYTWQFVANLRGGYSEPELQRIEYGLNTAAGLAHHAKVELTWRALEYCGATNVVPKGAQSDHHFGLKRLLGARTLTHVRSWVRETPSSSLRLAREVALSYDENALGCSDAPPLRYVTQLDDKAWNAGGAVVSAPPVRFSYGARAPNYLWTTLVGGGIETGTKQGPESARMDFDGDGVLDLMRVVMPAEGGDKCRLLWRKGSFGGVLAQTEEEVALPTAAWWNFGLPVEDDGCTLNGQYSWRGFDVDGQGCPKERGVQVAYHWRDWDSDGDLDLITSNWSSGTADACGDFNGTCAIFTDNQGGERPCDYFETPDSDGSCHCGSGEVWDAESDGGECRMQCPSGQEWNGGTCVDTCNQFDACTGADGSGPDVPPPPGIPPSCPTGSGPGAERGPTGKYVWRVFVNDPDRHTGLRFDPAFQGSFESEVALPLNGGKLDTATSGEPSLPRLADLDGDGWQDLVVIQGSEINSAGQIRAYRGLPDGQFATTYTVWTKSVWPLQDDYAAWPNPGAPLLSYGALELIDLNGDGLADIVGNFGSSVASPSLQVAYNMGTRFADPQPLSASLWPSQTQTEMTSTWYPGAPMGAGWRADLHHFTDVDGDGLPEMIGLGGGGSVSQPASSRFIYRFHGAQLAATSSVFPAAYEAYERLLRAPNRQAWYRASDVADVTSDGVPDLLTSSNVYGVVTVQTDHSGQPMRLMSSIDNGRGATTTFEYGHAADPSLVALDDGDTAPSRWVVRRVTVNPGGGQPVMTTRYAYEHPEKGPRSQLDRGPPQFLGFGRVKTYRSGQQGADSARTTREYDFDIEGDRRGHLVREAVDLADAGGAWVAQTEETHTYNKDTMLGGAVAATFLTRTVHRTFGGSTSPLTRYTDHTWTPYIWSPTGKIVFYENTETVEHQGAWWPVKRATVRDFSERLGQSPYAATDYRILLFTEDRQQVMGTTRTTLALTYNFYDNAGLPYETWVATGPDVAKTVRTFDATGVQLSEKRPRQVVATNGAATNLIYDAHKLFVVQTTNEKNQVVADTYDTATGALIRRRGPNTRSIPPAGCSFPQICIPTLVWETEEWRIDGFGRTTEHWAATDAASGGGYALTQVARTVYQDGTIPNRVIGLQLRDLGGSVWVTSADTFDGVGRKLTSTAYHQESGKPDRVTTYAYDAGGGLRETRVPDPRETTAYNAGSVTHTFERDGLGRVTRTVRPDGSSERAVYAGSDVTTTSYGPGGEPGSATTMIHDVFGRLVQVREHDNPTPGNVATTEYQYDELDRMVGIVDAAGVFTAMGYDMRGLRTSVSRTGRTWSYVYDLDGNMTSATTPVPAGGTAAQYTSSTDYDVLGRPTLFTPATRGMTSARMTQLGIGPISTTYDTGANGVGQVASTAQSGLFQINYAYNVRKQVKRETRTVSLGTAQGLSAALNVTQYVDRTYNALGAPYEVIWSTGQQWRYAYDALGQPSSVAWREPSSGQFRTLAAYTRTVAGAPRQRTSYWNQRRTWQYDTLGRVTYDRVHDGAGTTTWAERNYGYDALGRLGGVSGTIASHHADAVFEYDGRGRVLSAEGPDAYSATFTYGPSGNVLTAKVSGALDTPNRNVAYQYGAHDPQAVDRLVDQITGAQMAAMTYDANGSMISRTGLGATAGTLTWGGDSQLRETAGAATERHYYAGPANRIAAVGPDGVRLWFGEQEQLYSLAASPQRTWHHVAMGEPIARIETTAGTSVELQYADALQNLMLGMSTANTVNASFIHGAFGEVVGSTGASTHRRHFNGKEADAASGLRFYGYRYYDPVTLRWTAADPMFRFAPDAAWTEPQRANLYTFSLNNPLTYYDPDGRNPKYWGKKRTTPNWEKKDKHQSDDDPNTDTETEVVVYEKSGALIENENAKVVGAGVEVANGNVVTELFLGKFRSDNYDVAPGVTTQTNMEVLHAQSSFGKDGFGAGLTFWELTQGFTINVGDYSITLEAGGTAGVGAEVKKDRFKLSGGLKVGASWSENTHMWSSVNNMPLPEVAPTPTVEFRRVRTKPRDPTPSREHRTPTGRSAFTPGP